MVRPLQKVMDTHTPVGHMKIFRHAGANLGWGTNGCWQYCSD